MFGSGSKIVDIDSLILAGKLNDLKMSTNTNQPKQQTDTTELI